MVQKVISSFKKIVVSCFDIKIIPSGSDDQSNGK